MEDEDLPTSSIHGEDLANMPFAMFRCKVNGSDKLWGYYHTGCDHYVVYGKTGNKLVFYKKTFQSSAKCNQYAAKIVGEKIDKGYLAQINQKIFTQRELISRSN